MASDMKMFTADKFLGVNEAADGYTELKMGEASKMVNWAVTDAFNMTVRPGIERVNGGRTPAKILTVWSGFVGEDELLLVVDFYEGQDRILVFYKTGQPYYYCAFSGKLGLTSEGSKVKIFPFGDELFIMSSVYTVTLQWNYEESEFTVKEPYVPKVITGAEPAGGGTALENLNLLTPLRRMDFNGDGTTKAYVLPEEATGVSAITIDNTAYTVSDAGTFSASKHTFTFATAPAEGIGNVEIVYSTDEAATEESRNRIVNMPLVECYNGSTDTRLFTAGDGTNICYYTGVPKSGEQTPLYFPAMNEVAVDMSASPVTGMVRHYSKLIVFKPDGAYTITYEPVTLADGSTIAGFYLRPANREFGNEAMGQIQTVNNYPRTFSKGGIYEWRITSSYYKDERYAVRVSDQVTETMSGIDAAGIVTCDDNIHKTYYVFVNDGEGTVLVNRYGLNKEGIWYKYSSNLCANVRFAVMYGGNMVFATDTELFCFRDGAVMDAPLEIGGGEQAISAVWESGQMAFGADFRQKYSSKIYISMMPQVSSQMTVTASTDRRDSYIEKTVGQGILYFDELDFGAFSFNLSTTPKIQRIRLKVKKFVYYKLIFRVDKPGARATVLGYDQQVRFGSMAK